MTAGVGAGRRDPVSCHVQLRHFGLWRAAVALTAVCALAALAAWFILLPDGTTLAARIAGVVAAVTCLALAAVLMRVAPGTLSRQAGCWTFAPDAAGVDDPQAVELAVAIDLGSFLLLRLTPSDRRAGPVSWLQAQQRGVGSGWHALRCAVHAPRPSAPALISPE